MMRPPIDVLFRLDQPGAVKGTPVLGCGVLYFGSDFLKQLLPLALIAAFGLNDD